MLFFLRCNEIQGTIFRFATVTWTNLRCGSLIAGSPADSAVIPTSTDPRAVGHLYRFTRTEKEPAKVEDVAAAGQEIYALAYIPETKEMIGNTRRDGHLFTYDLQTRGFRDQRREVGNRIFETAQHGGDIHRSSGKRFVSEW
jgi:hypothetical protein